MHQPIRRGCLCFLLLQTVVMLITILKDNMWSLSDCKESANYESEVKHVVQDQPQRERTWRETFIRYICEPIHICVYTHIRTMNRSACIINNLHIIFRICHAQHSE